MNADESIDIAAWAKRIADDMAVFERKEVPIYHVPKREAAMHYVIRALANPKCEGSADVLKAIIARRGGI